MSVPIVTPPVELTDCPSTDTTHQSWKANESFAESDKNLSVHESPWTRTHLIIPHRDQTLFARPKLTSALNEAQRNRDSLDWATLDLQGRSLGELRESARREALEQARVYTADLLGESVEAEPQESLLFCSGHQPGLNHPGVWVKHFAIDALAKKAGATALNLVIDNDMTASRQLRLPAGDRTSPKIQMCQFDEAQSPEPWEEAGIQNPERFERFGDEVSEAMAAWNLKPLLAQIWPDAVAQSRNSSSLRDALTAARIKLERRWGLGNLELPLSRLCETEAFLWFAAAILTRLPRFWQVYNTVLAEFRQVNRIRSQTHPVPALTEEDGWYEAPFWIWPAGGSQRQRVRAKACSREVRLSDGEEIFARLPITPGGDVGAAVEVLKELPKRGRRFRTRALTTTLFSRLCLSDLFVHGIGGAKYDEMTDRIIARFFGLPAPGFLTVSCTVHLPLDEPFPARPEDEQDLRHQLRDIEFNPERHLTREVSPRIEALIAEKNALIAEKAAVKAEELDPANRRRQKRENHDRHLRLKAITEELAKKTEKPRQTLEAELETVRRQLRANAVLQDREFSFALYPEAKLRSFLTETVKLDDGDESAPPETEPSDGEA